MLVLSGAKGVVIDNLSLVIVYLSAKLAAESEEACAFIFFPLFLSFDILQLSL